MHPHLESESGGRVQSVSSTQYLSAESSKVLLRVEVHIVLLTLRQPQQCGVERYAERVPTVCTGAGTEERMIRRREAVLAHTVTLSDRPPFR